MANIFINGIAAKVGGGKSILNNYLALLVNSNPEGHSYFILCPDKMDYEKYETEYIHIISVNPLLNTTLLLPFTYRFIVTKLINNFNIDIIFNLADVPIVTKVSQIFLFDWSYAIYPESVVWDMMDLKGKIIRKYKLFLFERNIKYIDIVAAQTMAAKKRLENHFNLANVPIIPNAVSIDNLSGGEHLDFDLPKGKKLLYLTQYYQHKNIEIFLPLARLIKDLSLDYKLILTISSQQHILAEKFLNEVKSHQLDDVIINVGPVDMKHVPSLYKQSDALLMPTLLESFSGTYVEAMFHEIPIFTSDLDFARGVCGEGATYFDPFDEEDILSKLELIFNDSDKNSNQIERASKVLKELPDWPQVFQDINNLVNIGLRK